MSYVGSDTSVDIELTITSLIRYMSEVLPVIRFIEESDVLPSKGVSPDRVENEGAHPHIVCDDVKLLHLEADDIAILKLLSLWFVDYHSVKTLRIFWRNVSGFSGNIKSGVSLWVSWASSLSISSILPCCFCISFANSLFNSSSATSLWR